MSVAKFRTYLGIEYGAYVGYVLIGWIPPLAAWGRDAEWAWQLVMWAAWAVGVALAALKWFEARADMLDDAEATLMGELERPRYGWEGLDHAPAARVGNHRYANYDPSGQTPNKQPKYRNAFAHRARKARQRKSRRKAGNPRRR